MKRLTIVYGHYGSGKTNFALNLAMNLHKQGEKVTIVDLDIVNPYFRTADYTELLKKEGIKIISPAFAGTTVDAPALTPEIFSVFDNPDGYAVIDVGGDDVGAAALGRFASRILSQDEYEALYVINSYRPMVDTPEKAFDILKEIEYAGHVFATGIVNNSHLSYQTKAQDIRLSLDYAQKTAALCDLPLIYTTAPREVCGDLQGKIPNLYPVDIFVKLPWLE